MYLDDAVISVKELFSTPELVVTPHLIEEGDYMTLSCDTSLSRYRRHLELQFTFYRDGRRIQGPGFFDTYELGVARPSDSGTYMCEVSLKIGVRKASQAKYIQIEELISTLELKVTPYPVVEGDYMTLSCDTSPYRRDTELQFTFYRNEGRIKGPGLSEKYEREVAHLSDSGTYMCEVSLINGVRKSSQENYIQIQERFSTPKMVVTPYPVVDGDLVTLTCDTSLSPIRESIDLQYTFYRDGRKVKGPSSSKKYQFFLNHLGDSENYKCEVSTRNGLKKISQEEYFQIQELFSTPIMRVTPHSVLEGDRMILTCDTSLSQSRSTTELQYTFYKDGKKVQGPSSSKQYELQLAHLNDSATYNCEVSARDNTKKKLSQKEYIQIQEIFSTPQIQVDPYPVVEGGPMTLTCDTSLSSYRRTKDLQYTFCRDGRKVQEPGSSREYKVQSTDLEDSGNYKCEISTTNGIKKQSQEKHIPVQVLSPSPVGVVNRVYWILYAQFCKLSISPMLGTISLRSP
ncbi:Fc receptor-like protein 6 [Dendropsophus ebraccatus]|uniref:Fc receptor-like protein 6 n=1 Tax=Dendropsophus ebraccatus TaxID=150705 RepID=UPI003831CD3B